MIEIRLEQPQDISVIHALTLAAFTRDQISGQMEADLNNRLRDNGKLLLSLVAELDGQVVGHVAFSPARIDLDGRPVTEDGQLSLVSRLPSSTLALGPIAVQPDHQRQGIGSQLILKGFEMLASQSHDLIFLLGHPGYYPRFGFRPAKALGVRWSGDQSDGPCEPFMVKELREGALAERLNGCTGVFYFAPEFDGG